MTRIPGILVSLLLTTVALAQTADLNFVPHPQFYDGRGAITFAFVNLGPDIAKNTILTIDVPEGLIVERFSYGSGDHANKPCDRTQKPWRCQVGDVHVGFPPHYGGLDIRFPIAQANYEIKFAITSDTPDPNVHNNSGTVSWETRIEADVTVLLVPQTERIDPGQPAKFVANACNTIRGNRPPAVKIEFTAENGAITGITPAPRFACAMDRPDKWVCTIAELPEDCPFEPFRIEARASNDRQAGELRVTMRAISDLPDRDPASDVMTRVVPVYRWFAVTNTNDSGEGSLRDAITRANTLCTPGPCRIVFELPPPVPAEGWFTITPLTPLPSITAERVTLEGLRQTALTGNTNQRGPEVAIDGRIARRGLRMLATCEGVVNGLAIGNFEDDFGLWVSTGSQCGNRPDKREVTDNHIGVDPIGETPWPNQRGLSAEFASNLTVSKNVISHNRYSGLWMMRGGVAASFNLIEFNGASGIFLGPEVFSASIKSNVIRNNAQMAVAVARGAKSVEIRNVSMKDNGGLGIDWGLDGVSPSDADDHNGPSNAPVLLTAVYDAATNKTTIDLLVKSSRLGPYVNNGYLDFYTNDVPDGDGERHLATVGVSETNKPITVVFNGPLRGKWLNATWTREHYPASKTPGLGTQSHEGAFVTMTSELSNSIQVQ
jgi:Right handed beta helix region